jgi:hypothetical protein
MRLDAVRVLGLCLVLTAADCDGNPIAPDTCEQGLTLSVGTAVTGAVAGGDCAIDGRHADSYAFTVAAQSILRFNVDAQTGTDIRIRSASGELALNDHDQTQYATWVVLPPGDYILDVAASDDGDAGTYTINSTLLTAPAPVGCLTAPQQRLFAAVGVDVGGEITSNDCGTQFKSDGYLVYLSGQRTITVTGAMGTNIEILRKDQPGLLAQKALNNAGANALPFTPPQPGYYLIGVIGIPANATGQYSLKIE